MNISVGINKTDNNIISAIKIHGSFAYQSDAYL